MANVAVRKIKLDDIPIERLSPKLTRRVIMGEKTTVAQIWLEAGLTVPLHHHENEQIVHVIEGEMEFFFEDRESIIVKSGEILVLPANVPHGATVLKDTMQWDIFAPARADWLAGDDAYLRGEN